MASKSQTAHLKRGNPETQFQTGRQQVVTATKGGIASGEARRKTKSIHDLAQMIAASKVSDDENRAVLARVGISGKDATNNALVTMGLFQAACDGDVKAIDKWEQVTAEAEEKESGDTTRGRMFDLLAPSFLTTYQAAMQGKYNEIVEKGGRGSTKSSFLSILLLELLRAHPDCHAAVIRKIGNTLRSSVYGQCLWACQELLNPSEYKATVSPMEITLSKTGQKIMFFGMDDPAKLKSLKMPSGYVGILWFEELDQFAGAEEVRNVEQSCLRGGDFSMTLKSFNPPASQRNWANSYCLEPKPKQLIQHSDYRQVPEEWLGQRFLEDAEHLSEANPTAYRHEYLGEVTGCGKEIFTNVQADAISQEQINGFDRIYHGIDWGWYPDPFAFNSCYYDAARKMLFIYDELTFRRMSNLETLKAVRKRGVMQREDADERLTADSAEPKSCHDFTYGFDGRENGIRCLPALKGPGSVNESMKWLQSLNAIVIDPIRCPDTLKEFVEYEHDADKNGDPIEGYPDHDNHHIDAVRYAIESVWRRAGQ